MFKSSGLQGPTSRADRRWSAGFVPYSIATAATAALVDKISDIITAIMTVTIILVLSYFRQVFIVTDHRSAR